MPTFDPSRFQFIADALAGVNGFRDGGYLVQYPRESSEKFTRRKAIAWYANALRPACQRFTGYLTKRPPQREVTQPILAAFLDACNWQNDSLDVFFSQFMIDAKARGSMLLLVDMPAEGMETDRTWPALSAIAPEGVTAYAVNAVGALARVTFTDTLTLAGEETAVSRTYDETGWRITAGDKILEQGQHGLGVCPVVAFAESGLFPAEGEFATIADLGKRLYNLRSELDEILRAQTFSLLTYKVPTDRFPLDMGEVAQTIGTHNLLQTFDGGAEFIAPPEGPARVYLDVIAQLEALVRQTALIVDIPATSREESGVALQLRFQALNASLVHFARRMEDFERRVWELVGLWLGLEPNVSVSWGKDYSIADLKTEIEIAQNLAALNAPPAYQQAKLRQLIQLDLGALPGDDLAAILAGVDEMQQETARETEPPA
ncbi:MAG: hypothetical protein F9K25_10100 [Candidatus Contendobacter sp.]|nr:MAG: hypothetical protein F9K25_10100 [Candidatus Contendobacter sp.]